MFQMAGALGAMSVLPQSLEAKSFPTVLDRDIGDRADGVSLNSALDFLEAVEDLEDELDFIELIGRYSNLALDPSDRTTGAAEWPGGRCLFCEDVRCGLHVQYFGFFTTRCGYHGGGVLWISLMEGIPLTESVRRLRGMLDRGDLVGFRKRIEKQNLFYESLAAMCHDALMNRSTGTSQGRRGDELAEETIRQNQIGWLSVPLLRSFLTEAGWSRKELVAAGLREHPIRLYRKHHDCAALVMPVRDNRKRIIGFVDLTGPKPDWVSFIDENVISYRRWDRAVIRNRHAVSGGHQAGPLILTNDAWKSILLWQHGFDSVAPPARSWNRLNLRRILAMNTVFTHVSSTEATMADDLLHMLSLLGHDAARLRVAMLPDGLTGQALRARLDSAVPAVQVWKA
jgi:hypothetical protein